MKTQYQKFCESVNRSTGNSQSIDDEYLQKILDLISQYNKELADLNDGKKYKLIKV